MMRVLESRWQQCLSYLVVFACGATACGDDESAAVRHIEEAGLSARPAPDAARFDGSAPEAGPSVEAGVVVRDAQASTSAEAGPSTGVVAPTTDVSGTMPSSETSAAPLDGGVQEFIRCAPSKCTCVDPSAPDCCHEKLPYQRYVMLADVDAGLPSVDTHEVEQGPKTVGQKRDRVWGTFEASCGGGGQTCHVGPGDTVPWFQFQEFNFEDFSAGLVASCQDRVTHSDPTKAMPTGGGAGNNRGCEDKYVTLVREMEAYEASGFADEFEVPTCEQDEPSEPQEPLPPSPVGDCSIGSDPYRLTAELALAQTNLGQCIPTMHAESCSSSALKAMDDRFAAMQDFADLPTKLSETDLISLNSEILAGHRVYSYAPTYTLFSDNAKKQRYVRVPVGQTVQYNAETQDFDIPDNTRFYKTFLREVTNADGSTSYRKMETRLIVVRRDAENPDGTFSIKALRATYAWDKEEREANLVTDPLKNREPWADRMCPVVVDESKPRDPEKNPIITAPHRECTYMTPDEEDDVNSGTVRHYAIPGARRCDECHMGSNNHSYILGFSPWQVDRRPLGEGGVYDAPNPDELDQLKRFIEYGIISGISPGQAKLEESQGERGPRNEHELTAQGYMMGNCAFCHAPHGFPSTQNPVLKSLDFYPRQGDRGGIFQFPLDKTSPRVKVDAGQTAPIPYIVTEVEPWRWGKVTNVPDTSLNDACELSDYFCSTLTKQYCLPGVNCDLLAESEPKRRDTTLEVGSLAYGGVWGSLIWRNVFTPMTYPDTNTLFIHMPRNVPGFDCRAHKIMANWMLSIPVDKAGLEVPPEDARFKRAVQTAEGKLRDYLQSVTGQHCPVNDDIVDPRVLTSPRDPFTGVVEYPAPSDLGDMFGPGVNHAGFDPSYAEGTGPLKDGVPDHAHWISADYSSPPGEWAPKRSDWHRMITGAANNDLLSDSDRSNDALVPIIEELLDVKLTPEFEQFAMEPVPLGLWSESCESTAQQLGARQVKDFTWDARKSIDRWLTQGLVDNGSAVVHLESDRYVHEMSRGQAVFEAICVNCHGTNYDSRSPLATTIAELSGGNTLVADFRNGLFGPVEAPGANAASVFTFSDGNNGATPQDWLARYVLFMGMGGTLAKIPQPVVQLVSATPFYGQLPLRIPAVNDANMLEPAALKCRDLMNDTVHEGVRMEVHINPDPSVRKFVLVPSAEDSTFVRGTGHVQLWESLCNYGQRPVVRVMSYKAGVLVQEPLVADVVQTGPATVTTLSVSTYRSWDRSGNSIYPADAPVGNQLGQVTRGIQSGNTVPWCVHAPDTETRGIVVGLFGRADVAETDVPFCPEELLAAIDGKSLYMFSWKPAAVTGTYEDAGERDSWFRHGGYNAGLAALYYLMKRSSDPSFVPAPSFNSASCDLAGATPAN